MLDVWMQTNMYLEKKPYVYVTLFNFYVNG